jgi:2-oxoglutarate ferredoxin oxidoreductase subunit gamma
MEYAVLLAGFGGQGILSAGKFVATAALLEGREVSWLPSYGPEMRGGTANCSVIISDHPIGSPILNELDVLVALNGPSLAKFEKMVRPGGLILADCSLVHAVPERQDIRFIPIEASRLASEAGNMTFATIILLGCLSGATGCFGRDAFEKALYDALPQRHHHLIPQEMALFEQGKAFAAPT